MKKIFIFLTFFLIIKKVCAQEISMHQDTIKLGLYITSIRNIDFASNSFNADMWLWLHQKYHSKKEYSSIHDEKLDSVEPWFEWSDAIDANQGGQPKITRYSEENDEKKHIVWKSLKVSTQFKKKWDLRKYPFDSQKISINIESAEFDTTQRIIIIDKCMIDPNFLKNENEWSFSNFKTGDSIVSYPTTFGNTKSNKFDSTKYSSVFFSFELDRKNRWITFMKLFVGILISFLIALSVFFIKPTNLDARFGLCVGGLFSAIGSKYIVDGIIPVKYQNTLFDYIHNTTFLYILIITVISIISLRYYERVDEYGKLFSIKLDKIGLIFCSFSYFLIISLLVIYANN
jgi:hypothetical protein